MRALSFVLTCTASPPNNPLTPLINLLTLRPHLHPSEIHHWTVLSPTVGTSGVKDTEVKEDGGPDEGGEGEGDE